ncbi:MAG: lipocalin family protein [Candidatus Amulumruptor sp.]
MKKFFKFFMYLFMVTALASCGDDDKDEPGVPEQAQLLIGEWAESDEPTYSIVFLENGTGYDKETRNGSSSIDETLTWSLDGSNLTIDWESSGRDVFKIINLTETELILQEANYSPRSFYKK